MRHHTSAWITSAGCVALALAGCGREPSPTFTSSLLAFGTLVNLQVVGDRARAERLTEHVEAYLQQRDRDWHAWRQGELQRINAAIAAGEPVAVSESVHQLILAGQRWHRLSQGFFDVGAGRLVDLWGFHTSEYPVTAPAPTAMDLTRWREQRGSVATLELIGGRWRSTSPQTQLDFGGLAKGAALQHIYGVVENADLGGAMIDFGGDVLAVGRRGERAWRVAIVDPFADTPLSVVTLADGEAVFSSGMYARYREDGPERSGHILDPMTGRPAEGIVASSVVDHDLLRADAAATALVAAGPERWRAVALSMGVELAVVILADGTCRTTPMMLERLTGSRCTPVPYTPVPATAQEAL